MPGLQWTAPRARRTVRSEIFVVGRYGVYAAFFPVAANLHHHAIEMLLKGTLAGWMSPKDMKKLSHNLNAIWEVFKAVIDEPSLTKFDAVIEELNKFEDIRYPDRLLASEASIMFDITKAGATQSYLTGVSDPQFKLCLENVDELIADIFRISGRNPDVYLKMTMASTDARQYLERENAFFR
jgi:hypothetical protein